VGTAEGTFEGRCLDLESTQEELLVTVEFPHDRAPSVRLGGPAELEFHGGEFGSALKAEVHAVLRTDEAARRCYCFRGKLSKWSLLYLANRRRSSRFRPLASEPVRVRILGLGAEEPEVLLHDISATGLSVLVEPALEEQLYRRIDLRLAVHLPGQEEVELVATIRHRRLFASSILYGLEIDGRIPDFLRAQDRIHLYVAHLRGQQYGRSA
jgi:hypothetical protein